MTIMRFSEPSREALRQCVLDNRDTFNLCMKQNRKKSFLVEGETLAMIIDDRLIKREFV
jgi:phospholipid-transporting ATPase